MSVCVYMCAGGVEVVLVIKTIRVLLLFFFFFLLELIRTANKSLLRFHLSNKPFEAAAFCDLEYL